ICHCNIWAMSSKSITLTFLISESARWRSKLQLKFNDLLSSLEIVTKNNGESASADHEAARTFPQHIREIIAAKHYVPDQIFNCDETGLFWKRMPSRTWAITSCRPSQVGAIEREKNSKSYDHLSSEKSRAEQVTRFIQNKEGKKEWVAFITTSGKQQEKKKQNSRPPIIRNGLTDYGINRAYISSSTPCERKSTLESTLAGRAAACNIWEEFLRRSRPCCNKDTTFRLCFSNKIINYILLINWTSRIYSVVATFSIKGYLKTHIESVHNGVTLPCDTCGKKYSDRSSLRVHIKTVHNGVTHSCDICGKTFSIKGYLKTHVDSVHNGVTLPCDICGKTFTQKSNLQTHIKAAHNGVTHACGACGKKFLLPRTDDDDDDDDGDDPRRCQNDFDE
ncbi:unnamed protein product, partial [Trichogramma brassicae]